MPRYKILNELGRGGMSQVFLARDAVLDRKLVLKFIATAFDNESEFQERFATEARAAASLNHPNIVQVYDFGVFEEEPHRGKTYIAMELVEGQSLRKLILTGGLTLARAIEIISQICDALTFAHEQGVVHRDVKPENILLDKQGRVKLLDFGLAKLETSVNLTRTGMTIGSPGYMSPEQIKSDAKLDHRADIFSVGVILYEMLTGRQPFTGDQIPAVLYAVINDDPLRPSELDPDLPTGVDHVIAKVLAKSPEKRFQHASELAETLGRIGGEQEMVLHSPSTALPPATTGMGALPPTLPPSSETVVDPSGFSEHAPGKPERKVAPARIGAPRGKASLSKGVFAAMAVAALVIALIAIPATRQFPAGILTILAENWLLFSIALLTGGALWGVLKFSQKRRAETPGTSDQNLPPPTPRRAPGAEKTRIDPAPKYPSLVMKKPEFASLVRRAGQQVIEDIILHKDLERLENFIVNSEGGRIILTGYGRFGGTSLIKGAIKQARRELQQRGFHQGALLAFYYNVLESDKTSGKFEIMANDFSLGTLTTQQNDGGQSGNLLRELHGHAKPSPNLSETATNLTYAFSLTRPIDSSLLKAPDKSRWFGDKKDAAADFDFTRFIGKMNAFFTEDRDNAELQDIVFQLIGSETLPSRVIIILDRIRHLATLEALAELDLFRSEQITVIAVARKEDFDGWPECAGRLEKIGFRKWYVPCLWQSKHDSIAQLHEKLLKPAGQKNAEHKEMAEALLRHFEYAGRGIIGNVIEELKHPQYWSSDPSGNPYLRLDALPRQSVIRHNAWMQQVVNLNWSGISGKLFAGREMDEKEDRARIGVYDLIDWIGDAQIFTWTHLLEAAQTRKTPLSDNAFVLEEVTGNLLQVLSAHNYLQRDGEERFRLSWDKSSAPAPRKIRIRKQSRPAPENRKEAESKGSNEDGSSAEKPMLFYSYSHKDEKYREALEAHLASLKRQGVIEDWHDRGIPAGGDWRNQIFSHFDEAKIIVLLISADFLASDFCYEKEMKRAMRRHEKGEAVIIPIIIRPCDWQTSPFAKLQAFPKDALPVTSWKNPDDAWTNVAKGIRGVAEGF